MASAFGHAYSAFALRSGFKSLDSSAGFLWTGIICSILPDADVITFSFGIAYESFWGHRGFTHSIVFAVLLGLLCTLVFNQKNSLKPLYHLKAFFFFFLCTVSHGILDAMTTGGLGVAFFSPFNDDRYFLPWRPIKVSPLSAGSFFSEWGLQVIFSEIIWIGIPFTLWILIVHMYRKIRSSRV